MSIAIHSLAKINLYLRIVDRRVDGYHELETVFHPLKHPYDIITFIDSESTSISSTNEDLPVDSSNLCFKAIDAYSAAAAKKTGRNIDEFAPRWAIHIEKSIPMAAGLGGGSGNAATTLKAMNEKFNVFSKDELAKVAVEIGADVPFFLSPTTSIGRGVGEELVPASVGDEGPPILLACPAFPIRTPWLFREYDKRNQTSAQAKPTVASLLESLKSGDWEKLGKCLFNDFSPIVFEKFPLLQILQEEMMKTGAFGVELSGSGPSLFGIFGDRHQARNVQEQLGKKYGDSAKFFVS